MKGIVMKTEALIIIRVIFLLLTTMLFAGFVTMPGIAAAAELNSMEQNSNIPEAAAYKNIINKRSAVENVYYTERILIDDQLFDENTSFSILSGPGWLELDKTGILHGVPVQPENGICEVLIEIKSSEGLTDVLNFQFNVQMNITHFSYTPATGFSYSILINSATINGASIEIGDEIGVFDLTASGDTLCVGTVVFDGVFSIGLAAWIDMDMTTYQDGFITGQTMIFKFYDSSENKEYQAIAAYVMGDGNFGTGPLAIISDLKTEIATNVRDSFTGGLKYMLHENYPNPFNPETTIGFEIPKSSFVTLNIYNIKGELVNTLVAEELSASNYSFVWNGLNNSGIQVGSGLYFYHLRAGDYFAVKKMMYVR